MTTSTMTIGRAGQAGYTIQMPAQIQIRGNQLSCSGTAKGLSNADTILLLRDQFSGLNLNIDEPVVPIVFSGDTTLTGFYTDVSLDVQYDPGGWAHGYADWQLSATRLQSWSRPQVESTLMSAIRTNDLAITTAAAWWGPPPGIVDIVSYASNTSQTRTTDDGSYPIYIRTTGGITALAELASYIPDPTRWYESSASFSTLYGGTLRKTIGRNIQPLTAGTSGAWSISTGVVRLSPSSAGSLLLEGNTSGTWRTLATVVPTSSTPATTITSITVSRNTPAVVSARVGFIVAGIGTLPGYCVFLDIAARRGAPFLECSFSAANSGFSLTGETGANITGGLQRSANDSNGNRWFALAANGLARSIGPSASITTTNGLALGGLISGDSDTTTTVTDQYFATVTESVNFVTR